MRNPKQKMLRFKTKGPASEVTKEKIFYIDGDDQCDETRSEVFDDLVEYKDIVSVTIIYKLWHIADSIFKNLDAVSLLNCEKVFIFANE